MGRNPIPSIFWMMRGWFRRQSVLGAIFLFSATGRTVFARADITRSKAIAAIQPQSRGTVLSGNTNQFYETGFLVGTSVGKPSLIRTTDY